MTFTIDKTTYKSPNFNARPNGSAPNSIVIHTTEGSWPSDIEWLCNPQKSAKYPPVSCHYVISPDATIYQIVDDTKRAWHAGSGSFLGIADWNDRSIGIEVSHRFGMPWTPAQKDALRWLCLGLIRHYGIEQSRIVAHRWIAPDRRSDPTDWPDADFINWTAALYQDDWPPLWGDRFPYRASWGIPVAWRNSHRMGQSLGQAISDEMAAAANTTVQAFEHGYITWHPSDGVKVAKW